MLRAFRATIASSPREVMMNPTPTRGRNVTSDRSGQWLMAQPRSPRHEIPSDQRQVIDDPGDVLRSSDRIVLRQHQYRVLPELAAPLANEPMIGEDAGEHRPEPQDEERDQHDPRAFMHVVQRLLVGPRLAMEGHDQQTPGIKGGQESGEDPKAEGITANRGP